METRGKEEEKNRSRRRNGDTRPRLENNYTGDHDKKGKSAARSIEELVYKIRMRSRDDFRRG